MTDVFEFEKSLNRLDTNLFKTIPSQTTNVEKQGLLALQKALRKRSDSYSYLEIGSHLGGSIQPHLQDLRCRIIYSIDKRPLEQPDERGPVFAYPENSTARMLELLSQVVADRLGILSCIDDDAKDIRPERITDRPDLCFIDGEHTNTAVFNDFQFCLSVCKEDTVIIFHDATIIHKGIARCIAEVERLELEYCHFKMPGTIYVIALGSRQIMQDPDVSKMASNGRFFLLSTGFVWRAKKLLPEGLKPFFRAIYHRFLGER
jgi:hypothetical protein